MKPILSRLLAAALWLAAVPCALAAPDRVELRGGETPEQIRAAYTQAVTRLLPALARNDAAALRTLETTVHHAARPGAESERLACAHALADALQADTTPQAKAWLLRQLVNLGRAEVAPALARRLDAPDPFLREEARRALQHNPAPEAAAALRAALARAAEPSWQAALALALGARQDAASVPALAALLQQSDPRVLEAALTALGQIGDEAATRAVAQVQGTVPGQLQVIAAEAYLKCAERARARGQTADAAAIYRELNRPILPRSIRQAALVGGLRCAGDRAAGEVLKLLAGADADARSLARGFIAELPAAAAAELVQGVRQLPAATQPDVLAALTDRGEKAALPLALDFARQTNEPTRLAGLRALGRLGDASTVDLLVEALRGGGNAAGAARESLISLAAPGASEAVAAAMGKESDPETRAGLIEVLEARNATETTPALLGQLNSESSRVRRAALRALGRLAGPDAVPAMTRALLKTPPGGEREEAEKAVAAVCARLGDPGRQAEAVLEIHRTAGPAEQLALLPLLGRLGGAKALEVVRAALASADPAMAQAGLAALANWPEASETVEEELLARVRQADRGEARASALRAYLRAVTLPSGASEKEKLAKFQKAMAAAGTDAERGLVLERVAEARAIETLRFLVPYLDQPALAAKAGTAIVELAKHRPLRERNAAEFEAALTKVVSLCRDAAVVERAKRRLQEK